MKNIIEGSETDKENTPNQESDKATSEANNSAEEITEEDLLNSAFVQSNQKKPASNSKPKGTTNQAATSEALIAGKIEKKKFLFGILFSKIGNTAQKDVYSSDIRNVMGLVFQQDIDACILPHDRSTTGAMDHNKFMKSQGMDYTKFIDLKLEQWGSPREAKTKTAYSFYVASDQIEEDLKILRDDNGMKTTLAEQSMRMSPHKLRQSCDVNVGYFLGKTQLHTYRAEMEDRLQMHLQESQAKEDLKKAGQAARIPPMYILPPTIPISVRNRTHTSDDTTADVVAIFVGKNDEKRVLELLQEYTFPLVTIIHQNCKKHHGDEWNKGLELHNSVVSASTAIKITNASESFRKQLLETVIGDASANSKIIDIAKKRSNAKEDIIHVQCIKDYKESVTTWLNKTISLLSHAQDNQQHPKIVTDQDYSKKSTVAGNNTSKKKMPPPPQLAKFEILLTQPKYWSAKKSATAGSLQKRNSKVPAAIVLGQRPLTAAKQQSKSYAQVAESTTSSISNSADNKSSTWQTNPSGNSEQHSNTPSTKTQREIQLEEELQSMAEKLSCTEETLEMAQSTIVNMQTEINAALEANAALKEQLAKDMAEMETKMEEKFELRQTLLEKQLQESFQRMEIQLQKQQSTATSQEFESSNVGSETEHSKRKTATSPEKSNTRQNTNSTPLKESTNEGHTTSPVRAQHPPQYDYDENYHQMFAHVTHQQPYMSQQQHPMNQGMVQYAGGMQPPLHRPIYHSVQPYPFMQHQHQQYMHPAHLEQTQHSNSGPARGPSHEGGSATG